MNRIKLRFVVISLAAIFVSLFAQTSLAYYTKVQTATNVVTAGGISFTIYETMGDGTPFPEEGVYVIPGQTVGKTVTIQSNTDHPFYLRVKLVDSVNSTELSSAQCLEVDLNEQDWVLREDGYLYYNKVVEPNVTTAPVFTNVTIVGDQVDNSYIGKTLSLTVNAQAVQQENNPAEHPWDAQGWPSASN